MNIIDQNDDFDDIDVVDRSELNETNFLDDGVPDCMESGQSLQFALPEIIA